MLPRYFFISAESYVSTIPNLLPFIHSQFIPFLVILRERLHELKKGLFLAPCKDSLME